MRSLVPGASSMSLIMVVLLSCAIVSSLLCIVFAGSDHCGTSVGTLVFGGQAIVKGEYPWLAALYKPEKEGRWEQYCGGALISPRIIVTAAHCLFIEGEVLKAKDVKVGLGKLYRDFYHNEDTATIANVRQIVVHHRYVGELSSYALDVGLLKLSVDIDMSEYILPVCIDLDTMTTVGTGAMGYVAGWGTTENGTSSDKALAAHMSYQDTHTCLRKIHSTYRKFVTIEKFCSITTNGSQVDKGDSGGALTLVKNGRHYVIGVVSTKIRDESAFSIFTDLSTPEIHYWLKDKISKLSSSDNGFLLIHSKRGFYQAPAVSTKELVPTPLNIVPRNDLTAIDCVTGDIYFWFIQDNTIKRVTENRNTTEDFIVLGTSSRVMTMTLDWNSRLLYWLEQNNESNTTTLKGANISSGKLENIAIPVSQDSKSITFHPTLRKIYILQTSTGVQSVDIDSPTPTLTLFHEEQADRRLNIMNLDWLTDELCMFTDSVYNKVYTAKDKDMGIHHYYSGCKLSNTTRCPSININCKNVVNGTMRTVLVVSPWYPEAFAISPHYYYWAGYKTIYSVSKSSSSVEEFFHSEIVNNLYFVPDTCSTRTPAPGASVTD